MPTIDLENDPSIFKVQVKDKVFVILDVLELMSAFEKAELGTNPPREELVKVSLEVLDVSSVKGITDDELVAVAMKSIMRFKELGNEPRPLPALQRPMDGPIAPPALRKTS